MPTSPTPSTLKCLFGQENANWADEVANEREEEEKKQTIEPGRSTSNDAFKRSTNIYFHKFEITLTSNLLLKIYVWIVLCIAGVICNLPNTKRKKKYYSPHSHQGIYVVNHHHHHHNHRRNQHRNRSEHNLRKGQRTQRTQSRTYRIVTALSLLR